MRPARPSQPETWTPPGTRPAQGRRVIKAAASGRHAPATRPGTLRDLVEEHLRRFPDATFTPHQIGKALTRSAGAVANALDKLVSLGTAQMVTDKPRSYRLAPRPRHPPPTLPATPVPAWRPRPAPRNARHAPARGRRLHVYLPHTWDIERPAGLRCRRA